MIRVAAVIEVKLNQILKKRGRTLYWLAKETGISYRAISNLSKGNTKAIEFETLDKVCQALKCEAGEILRLRR